MAGQKQPIDLVIARGKKHLTKAEIAQRKAEEVSPCMDDISPPTYLSAPEKKRFKKLANQLSKINIIGETDTEALARYVTAQSLYEDAVKDVRKTKKKKPRPPAADADTNERNDFYNQLDLWRVFMDSAIKRQDRYFKQAQTAAAALGLTISSRCKLVAPIKEEPEKVNKFAKFGTG